MAPCANPPTRAKAARRRRPARGRMSDAASQGPDPIAGDTTDPFCGGGAPSQGHEGSPGRRRETRSQPPGGLLRSQRPKTGWLGAPPPPCVHSGRPPWEVPPAQVHCPGCHLPGPCLLCRFTTGLTWSKTHPSPRRSPTQRDPGMGAGGAGGQALGFRSRTHFCPVRASLPSRTEPAAAPGQEAGRELITQPGSQSWTPVTLRTRPPESRTHHWPGQPRPPAPRRTPGMSAEQAAWPGVQPSAWSPTAWSPAPRRPEPRCPAT